ncbi:MAG: hypothetical protein QOG87_290 [Actinomycetota bacterium]
MLGVPSLNDVAALVASIVVCTIGRPDMLRACLASLSDLDHESYEVLVVDNTMGDTRSEELAREAGARYLNVRSPGLSKARNAGARAATGELVAFIDDDAVADPGWLARHEDAFIDSTVAVTTGRVIPMDTESLSLRTATEDLGASAFRLDRRDPHWFERANFGGVGIGANMVFRRSLFESGWGFSPQLGLGSAIPGGEENHAFFTLLRDGHAIVYVPDAKVWHAGRDSASVSQRREQQRFEAGVSYMWMLLREEPSFRLRTLRYMAGAAAGRRRPWRDDGGPALQTPLVSRVRALAAGTLGYAWRSASRRRTSG